MENQKRRMDYLNPVVQKYFKFPNTDDPEMRNGGELADFIVLLLQILDNESPSYANGREREHSYGSLRKNLTFLHTVLGDTPFQFTYLEDIKNVLVEFEFVANEAGSFVYSCVSASSEVRHVYFDDGIQALLEKVENLNTKIKELPYEVLCFPTARSISVRSPFVIDSLLEDIEGLVNGRFGLTIDDVKDQIDILVEELSLSKNFMKGVEILRAIHTNELKEFLIHIVIDAAYEAEYLINTYTLGHIPGWYLNLRLPVIVQDITLNRIRLQETEKINDVKDLENANNFARGVSFKNVRNPESVLETSVIGFDNITKTILNDLIRGPKELQIVSIIGMSGSGKTTVARKLYEDPSINSHFDLRVWCTVSQPYDKTKMLDDILMGLASTDLNHNISKVEDTVTSIHKILQKRRYLIILDDIWDASTLDDLKICCQNDDGNGSRILLTSQIKDNAPTDSIFRSPPVLSKSQCYDLLMIRVLNNGPCPPELLRIARRIASKCHGLPLAVVVIGGIMANLEMEEWAWEKVEMNLDSSISNDPIRDILELSYRHLPNHLKPCFLFLGNCDRETEITVGKLIHMWIALGFVHQAETKNKEQIAEIYLSDLINRSLLTIEKKKSSGGIRTCRIHNLLNDMRLKIAEKENFLDYIDQFSPIYQKYSHLALYSTLTNTFSISVPHCRSLLGFMSPLGHSVAQMPLLRIMHLLHLSDNNYVDDIRRICGLVHLRYLSLYNVLPDEICKLVSLKYFHLDTKSTVLVPSTILKMVKLRHISITSEVVFQEKCDLSKLTSNIKSLSRVRIRTRKEEKILVCTPHLRKLKCVCDVFFPDLISLKDLESLNIILLKGEPTKINFPSNLIRLTLSGTCLPWGETSVVGKLPNLEVLKLHKDAFVGNHWETVDGEFQKLRFLKLYDISSLQQWTTCDTDFPELQGLVLDHVQVLIPSELGFIATLEMIEVRNCGHKVNKSAIQIRKEQRKYGNADLKIITSGSNLDKGRGSDSNEDTGSSFYKGGGSDSNEDVGSDSNEEARSDSDKDGDSDSNEDTGSDFDNDAGLGSNEDTGLDFGKDGVSDSNEDGGSGADKEETIDDVSLQASSDLEGSPPSVPRFDHGSFFPPYPFFSEEGRYCTGCYGYIWPGEPSRLCNGSNWHATCFRCHGCTQQIFEYKLTISDSHPYHDKCFQKYQGPRCVVCKDLFQPSAAGRIHYDEDLFFLSKYCSSHKTDGTPACFSCCRVEPLDSTYLILDDGRKLCLECLESSIMDTDECQSLYLEIRDFFEGLNMKTEQQFPLFLVDSQALNEVMQGKDVKSPPLTRTSLSLFNEHAQVVITPDVTEPHGLFSKREVIAILVLYGLPRLLTGKLIVYEMMLVWLELQGYWSLGPGVREGICQVLAHMWLEPEIVAGSSKKGKRSEFDKKLGEYLKYRIAYTTATFAEGMDAVEKYGLRKTLEHLRLTGTFPVLRNDDEFQIEGGELLSKAFHGSLDYGSFFRTQPNVPEFRICAGCYNEIGHGKSWTRMSSDWHPECFCCSACSLPISDYQFPLSDNLPYHTSCLKKKGSRCDVCKSLIPPCAAGVDRNYLLQPLSLYKYCLLHKNDGTPKCCSCLKMKPVDSTYLILDDGRNLCLECFESSIMDTGECQPLYLEIQDYFEGLNMEVEQQFPLFLVETQVLNNVNDAQTNTSLCLFERHAQDVTTPNFTSDYSGLVSEYEVTAILVVYGLPRLLAGSTIAYEMMRGWLVIQGYGYYPGVEEGICRVLSHMWLEAEIVAGSSKKGDQTEYEKKLGKFLKDNIESDPSEIYGDGFRDGIKAVEKYGLRKTLDHIRLTGAFPF